MAVYNDLYIRDTLQDNGTYPSTGTPYTSPDLIPFLGTLLEWGEANATYNGPDIGEVVINDRPNNLYVRAKNLGTAPSSGTASLYYANASLFLMPNTWTEIRSAEGDAALQLVDEKGDTTIQPNGVAISNPAFLLTSLPEGAHYCLIGVLQTPSHRVVIPRTFQSNAEFSLWVKNNPAVGQRNISYIPSKVKSMTRNYDFGNANSTEELFHFSIVGEGFEQGTEIVAESTDEKCQFLEKLSLPAPNKKGQQITGFDVDIPGNYRGAVTVSATSENNFPEGATLSVNYYQYPVTLFDLEAAAPVDIVRKMDGGKHVSYAAVLIHVGRCTLIVSSSYRK
ncbi:hypothetical protein [Pandoraea pulmonicola]|uniref:Uncharacterized protein n=1 Tax=Pandoraea pulmonicola TaxID=93221 RepID=A0AAJ4ZFK3_PANPU|nr:hypothetical protein [Pandoraea pulmonicola]SUA92373.1 Uncharacterised protein [Pandoraea pulmonicola]